jgi:hypothetical protein
VAGQFRHGVRSDVVDPGRARRIAAVQFAATVGGRFESTGEQSARAGIIFMKYQPQQFTNIVCL